MMKYFIITFFISVFTFVSCKQENTSISNSATVQFLEPGPCCSNMELIDGEPVFSDSAGYDKTLLAAVNIDDFNDLEIEHGNTLKIEYKFTSENFPCNFICNRLNGIPIEVISIEKL